MQIDQSFLKRELHPWLQLKSRPLSPPNRRWLKHLADEAAMPEMARTIRAVIDNQLSASSLSLVRLPRTPTGIGFAALLIPPTEGAAIDTTPAMFIIDDRREIQQVIPDVLHWEAKSHRLHLSVSQAEFTNGIYYWTPIAKADLETLNRGDAVARLAQQRRAVWEDHVCRLRMSPDRGRHPKRIERSQRFFNDVTKQIVVPLLNNLQTTERKLLGDFLLATSERPVLRIRRPSKIELQRNRRQAVECYPFLEGLWATEQESPAANSLTSQLRHRDRAAIKRAIDHGQPLSDLLTHTLSLEPWMIEHLRCHWPVFLEFDRLHCLWDIGSALSVWTPESAPKTLDELLRSDRLTSRIHGCVRPFDGSTEVPISSENRRTLRRLVQSKPAYEQMDAYLQFIHNLNEWISVRLGRDHGDELPRRLGTQTANDWWMLARRWHSINTDLSRFAGRQQVSDIQFEWPALLSRSESIRDYTFTSLRTFAELKTESDTMKNCTSCYLVRCALGESHMIHVARDQKPIATLEVRKGMYGENIKILLEHAEAPHREPLDSDTETAIMELLDACNDGRLELNQQALAPQSIRVELLEPMMQLNPIDYPTWERANLEYHYFDLHANVCGANWLNHYRAALELTPDREDSLYQLALRAIKQYPTRCSSSHNITAVVAGGLD